VTPTNLPLELTSLVGRDRELEELGRLLMGGARFVTLTGPGGSGKTRLGREAARALLPEFDDGAFLVSLAPIRDPELVLPAIAQAIDLRPSGSEPLIQSLKTFLSNRSLLLLLDNFEQVVQAGALVLDLLGSCPRLSIVVTSRAPLRVTGEREFPVPPLALPDQRHLPPAEDLLNYASVRLFLERAGAVNPKFQADSEALRYIAAICARLDGLPLAIELAAARSRLLTPAVMLARLNQGLPILASGAQDLPERQKTLSATISWSYDLLGGAEQVLFRHLSVFAGGCNLESVEAVSEPNRVEEVFEGVASLAEKNLLYQVETAGTQPRFAMLETVREFGLEMLELQHELFGVQARHAQHFLAVAETADGDIPGPDQQQALSRLEQEHENLQAALRWYSANDTSAALRLAAALAQFWQLRGYVREGRFWLERLLSSDDSAARAERAKALASLGMLAIYQSDFELARRSHQESLDIYRFLGDRWSAAVATNDLGTVALYEGNYPRAQELYQESLSLRREIGDRRGGAVSLTNLGLAAQAQGDLANARSLHEESLELRRELNDPAGIARSLDRLATVLSEQGDYASAQDCLNEAIMLARQEGDEFSLATSLMSLGAVALARQDYARARTFLEESRSIWMQLEDKDRILRALWNLSRLAEAERDFEGASAYCESAFAIAAETGNRRGLALWQARLGDIAVLQGRTSAAQEHYEYSLAMRQQIGDEGGAAILLGKLAQVSHMQGDLPGARRLLEQSVAALRPLPDREGFAAALVNLAQIANAQADFATADVTFRDALALQHLFGNLSMVRLSLRGLAVAALGLGDVNRAAFLAGALEGLGESIDPDNSDDLPLSQIFAEQLNPEVAASFAAGRGFGLDEAVQFALDGADALHHAQSPLEDTTGLSQRELEVLRLVAAGKSNPEVAAELYISVNTVYRHVSNIFSKIGASNRVEAATYARSHGLVI
jgi:predicted ATPase/DNA-binding CsgD family transcriptional regulator